MKSGKTTYQLCGWLYTLLDDCVLCLFEEIIADELINLVVVAGITADVVYWLNLSARSGDHSFSYLSALPGHAHIRVLFHWSYSRLCIAVVCWASLLGPFRSWRLPTPHLALWPLRQDYPGVGPALSVFLIFFTSVSIWRKGFFLFGSGCETAECKDKALHDAIIKRDAA